MNNLFFWEDKATPQLSKEKPIVADLVLKERMRNLSSRIREYKALEKQLKKEKKSDIRLIDDLRQTRYYAEYLLKTYKKIDKLQKKQLTCQSKDTGKTIYRPMIERLFQGLTKLEGGYFKDRYKAWFAEDQFSKQLNLDIKEMESFCSKKDYRKLMESYEMVKNTYGDTLIPLTIKFCYANALSRSNKVKEAITVVEEIIENGPLNAIEMRYDLVDWYLKKKDLNKALENFKELSFEVDRGIDIFLLAEKKVTPPTHDKLSDTTKKLSIDDIRIDDMKQQDATGAKFKLNEDIKKDEVKNNRYKRGELKNRVYLDNGLKKVNTLKDQGKFEEAHVVLVELEEQFNNCKEIDEVKNALNALRLEENKAKEKKEDERFLAANRLIENEKYEEAIKKLNRLRQSKKYSKKSHEKIQIAIDEFAKKKRKEASELFFMAKRKADPFEKKELLRRSLKLLEDVRGKYPTSSYSGKIIMNIETIKKEIERIEY
jgi:tetratricopeptide (TPR) repeat protein